MNLLLVRDLMTDIPKFISKFELAEFEEVDNLAV